MSEIIFGTPEHVAGLSRKALEEDFQWVNDRRMELEGECERLDAKNAKLRELVRDMWHEGMCECGSRGKCASCEYVYPTRMRELGIEIEVDE